VEDVFFSLDSRTAGFGGSSFLWVSQMFRLRGASIGGFGIELGMDSTLRLSHPSWAIQKTNNETPRANQHLFTLFIPTFARYPSSPERFNSAKGFVSVTSNLTLSVFHDETL
jgi:hypothetical protein